jgi:DNA repair exonuclease SbcCD ATPase subunit
MANNENSDGIETNDSINKINDSNNNVFNLEVLTKELLEIKSQLGKVNELAEHLQKELIKEKKKNLKERNEELLESHSQESETVIREKSKLKDLKKGLNKKKIKEVKERTEGLAESMDSSFQELESILENEKLKIEDLPDLEPLLEKLDNKYFKGILKKNNVKVTYSKKMFVSAGACVEEEDNRFCFHYRFKILKSFF